MASKKTARVVIVGLLLPIATAAAARAPVQASQVSTTSRWALEVLTLGSTPPTVFWVGLVNKSEEARLVCVLDRGIKFKEKDGTSKGTMSGGSPHACKVDDQFDLIRAGQTRFVRLPVPPRLPANAVGRIQIELGVVERSVENGLRTKPIGVRWEGTLQEAADVGRAVTGVAQKVK